MTQTLHDRYPGPYSFDDTPQDRRIFFGRSPEIELLSQQIIAARLLVLFGKSGLGKTSLLQAGVFPRLRAEGVLPIPVRLATSAPLMALVADAARSVSEEFGIDYTPGEMASLWEFFKTAMFWRDDTLLVPVLVFDQLEEIFTLKEAGFREVFSREVGTVVSGNPPETFRARVKAGATEERLSDDPPKVKIVMSLREEYLGALEELSRDIPRLFQERFRLLPLAEVQAREAIQQPALLGTESLGAGEVSAFNTPPFEYEEATLREMVAFLKGRSEAIEPFQLQLLCQHLERKMPKALRPGVAHITVTPSDLGGRATMDAVLQQFYREAMAALPRGQRRRAQELCERGLLTMAGNRLLLQEDQIRGEYRVSDKTLGYLVDQRLLRREPRLESLFYELSHDTLAHSIVQIRRWRIPKTYRFAAVIGLVAVLALSGTGIWFVISVRAEKEQAESSEKQALLALQETEKAKQEAVQNFEQATQMKERAESSEKQALLAQQEVMQNFRQATSIVDDFLTKLDEEKTRDVKGFEPVRKELGEIGLKHYREFTRQLRKELGEIGLKHYREFTRQRGDDPSVRTWVWYKLGVSLSNLDSLDEAIAAYHRQLEFKPDHEHAWNSLGNALHRQGKYDEAIAAYHRQLEVKPDDVYAWNSLGDALLDQGKVDEAIAAFQQQVDVKPDHEHAWNSLGRALARQGKVDEAIAAYHRQLEVKPDHTSAWANIGLILWRQGKNAEAATAFAQGLAVQPQNLSLLSNDAELALVEGDSDRLHRRVDVALPQVAPKDQLFVILPFLTWLANPAQGWAPVITAINTLEPGVEFTWNFSTTRPAITRLDVSTQQAAQHFIDFFEGRIDRPTLQAQLAANEDLQH